LEGDKICEATLETVKIKERSYAAVCCNAEPQDQHKLTAYVHNVYAAYPSTFFAFNKIALQDCIYLSILLGLFPPPVPGEES
jgi:hypothetical protein